MSFIFLSLFLNAQLPEPVTVEAPPTTNSLADLDAAILKKRMEEIYGEFGRVDRSTWVVDFGGKSREWQWDGTQFICETPEPEGDFAIAPTFPDCNDWAPLSFKWWQSKNAWLEPWVSFKKIGYELSSVDTDSKPRRSVEIVQSIITAEDSPTEAEELDEEPILLGGKRPALEAWAWRSLQDEQLKVYTSLRNNWIERIDHGSTTEYIEWTQANSWTKPKIRKLFIERAGIRLGMTRKSD